MCVTKNIATVYDKIRGQPGVSIFAFSIVQDKVHLLFLLGILLSGFSVASVNLEGPNIRAGKTDEGQWNTCEKKADVRRCQISWGQR